MLDHIALKLDREGIKGREKSKRGEGGGGGVFLRGGKGGDKRKRKGQGGGGGGGLLFEEAIDRGTAILRGDTVSQKATHNSS